FPRIRQTFGLGDSAPPYAAFLGTRKTASGRFAANPRSPVMTTPLQSLVASGTKLWLDSIDPDEVARNRAWGATGATSNPIIIADLIKTGRFDAQMTKLIKDGLADADLAWHMTDMLLKQAQQVFLPSWQQTRGDDGYVSFELDPLLEDPKANVPVAERTRRYVELGKRWSAGQQNRMIKVPATE